MQKLTQITKLTNNSHMLLLVRGLSQKIEVNPNYENRNPRNLEWSGHQYKRFGWNLQYPPKDFYHQIVFNPMRRHLDAYVEHHSGTKIIHISTKEHAIRQYLYSATDLCAAQNLGRVLADRCIKFGITQMIYFKSKTFETSKKEQLFYKTLVDSGLKLEEPAFIERGDMTPGLDYDNVDFHQEKLEKPN